MAGTNIPAFAISAAKPIVLRVTVFPPVFGPVMATTLVSCLTKTSIGTTAVPSSCFCCQTNKGWRRRRRVVVSSLAGSINRGGLASSHKP